MLHSFAETHIGQRQINEDSYLVDKENGLYIVADGVGGMDKGEVASHIACETISASIKSGLGLKASIQLAHQDIINQIQSDEHKQGMATTVVVALFKGNSYEIAWVGDSRAYIWDEELKLITRDDSYVELLLENGHIGVEELDTHPDRNVISQALGIVRKDIKINFNSGTLEEGQILLLCTDGLYSIANELNIITSLKHTQDIQKITHALVEKAVSNDGKDNITLLAISSSVNSGDKQQVVKPKVFREFDMVTGKAKNYDEQKAAEVDNQDAILYMDPELVNQTKLEDVAPEDKDRLETAAHQFANYQQPKSKMMPMLLVGILGLIGVVLWVLKIKG
jgi:protein phosphatase